MRLKQAVKHLLLAAIPTLVLLGIAGCKCGERTTVAEDRIPEDLSITFGQQGVFAGRSVGYTIDGDGRVARWEGKFPGDNEQAAATVDAGRVRQLWRRAEDIGILRMRQQAMTTQGPFITVTADGESRRITWVPGSGEASTPVQEFYDECMDVAKSALGETPAGESR